MPDHLLGRVTVVGMLVPTAEDRIDDQSPPVQLQMLEFLYFFVGRIDAVVALCIVVVHYYGVDAEFNDIRFNDVKPPDKQALQKTSEQIYPDPGKRIKKTFYPV